MEMNKYRILVFDVETTGLLPKDPMDLNPYIIQFSFILYNLQTRAIERKHDFYINPPIDIPDKITELTGITKETCVKKGVPIIVALDCFYECYTMSNTTIAHNMAFDATMVRIEIERNREELDQTAYYCLNIFDATFEKVHGIDRFCTMRYGTNICNIMVSRKPTDQSTEPVKIPTKYKKWPTLLEFHKHLFNTVPDNLHNSIVDVLVCLRCYLKSCKRIVIDDAEFSFYIALE